MKRININDYNNEEFQKKKTEKMNSGFWVPNETAAKAQHSMLLPLFCFLPATTTRVYVVVRPIQTIQS